MKLYWLLHTTPDDDVRTALLPFGTLSEISRQKWRVQGCADKGSHTRLLSRRLKEGYTAEDLPHQLRVGEDHPLVHAPGPAPLGRTALPAAPDTYGARAEYHAAGSAVTSATTRPNACTVTPTWQAALEVKP
ncbi:hypothetical protein HPB50_026915 [Hyalomma asiaticum]|uniref:Uncharacterized protein n=1 Tax=Hyalomma asiaticum TaxID=266040 RepID=A0ACB7S672_HYAAI|nr:hypothetical protein HPB50_026915 [Hyalomma asiaticum]